MDMKQAARLLAISASTTALLVGIAGCSDDAKPEAKLPNPYSAQVDVEKNTVSLRDNGKPIVIVKFNEEQYCVERALRVRCLKFNEISGASEMSAVQKTQLAFINQARVLMDQAKADGKKTAEIPGVAHGIRAQLMTVKPYTVSVDRHDAVVKVNHYEKPVAAVDFGKSQFCTYDTKKTCADIATLNSPAQKEFLKNAEDLLAQVQKGKLASVTPTVKSYLAMKNGQ